MTQQEQRQRRIVRDERELFWGRPIRLKGQREIIGRVFIVPATLEPWPDAQDKDGDEDEEGGGASRILLGGFDLPGVDLGLLETDEDENEDEGA